MTRESFSNAGKTAGRNARAAGKKPGSRPTELLAVLPMKQVKKRGGAGAARPVELALKRVPKAKRTVAKGSRPTELLVKPGKKKKKKGGAGGSGKTEL